MSDHLNIDAPLTEGDAEALFKAMLRRPMDNDALRDELVAKGVTLRQLIIELRSSRELELGIGEKFLSAQRHALTDPLTFRCPQELVVTRLRPRRIILIGSCLMELWTSRIANIEPELETELYLLNSDLPISPQRAQKDYDFQIVQLPLRSLISDSMFARLTQSDLEGHQNLFDHGLTVMRFLLNSAMRWNRDYGLLSFVLPVLPPQQNLVGRLMPRYDIRNPVYFVERLNESLANELAAYQNCYFVDLNEQISTHGRRFVQEDMLAAFNHGGFLSDFDFSLDQGRMDLATKATDLHEARTQSIVAAAWEELVAMYRTVRQTDSVKLVVVDLDDTLWRGMVADTEVMELPTTEGWPKGLWEALLILKRRGLLLAIISKNDVSRVREVWQTIFGYQLRLDDFAAVRINWEPKPANMAEILAELNLLPCNVVYIDDHPSQREEMQAVFPELRVLAGNPLEWRRILLWSAETQVPEITAESGRRTSMVQSQIVREEARRGVDAALFRAQLDVRMELFAVTTIAHPRFARTLELLNKTNQFNTSGKRWTQEECIAGFASGTRFYAFDLRDKYTVYGLVAVLVVADHTIHQFVMSCRVMGLEAELAAIATLTNLFARAGCRMVQAMMVPTDRNLACRDVYAKCGFRQVDGGWLRVTSAPMAIPHHVTITISLADAEMPGRPTLLSKP